MLSMQQLVSHWLLLPDSSRQDMPMSCLDPKRKIIVMKHPYHEDYIVLPTRASTRPTIRLLLSAILSTSRHMKIHQHPGGPLTKDNSHKGQCCC